MSFRSIFAAAALSALSLSGGVALAQSANTYNTVDGVALHGFDPVAYFDQHKPVKGTPDNSFTYQGITYEFASKAHLDTFQKSPDKFLPLYGGFCTTAVSEGVKADIDPHAFSIHDGKLSVFYSDGAKAVFDKNTSHVLKEAAQKWPDVQTQSKVIR